MFQRVVLVPSRDLRGWELGLVTSERSDRSGARQWAVFVPGSPNPTTGRLLLLDASEVRPIDMPVSEALKSLVAVGKTPLPPIPHAAPTNP